MSLLGIDIEIHDTYFGQTTFDDQWLPEVGRRGWRVLTQDPKFLSNESEKQALIDYGVGCFVLVVDQLSRWEKMRLIAKVWDQIEEVTRGEEPPYIYRITKSGEMRRLYAPSVE
jgi:hypothetical protein